MEEEQSGRECKNQRQRFRQSRSILQDNIYSPYKNKGLMVISVV